MPRFSIVSLLICILFVFNTCRDMTKAPSLIADAGPDQEASIGDTVWFDHSASIGHDYEVLWTIQSQPGTDTITNPTSDSTAYLIPSFNGTYSIRLTITKEDQSNDDYMNVYVSGPVIFPSTIARDTTIGRRSEGTETDYTVLKKLTISAELTIQEGVIIQFADDVEMVITENGKIIADNVTFTASDNYWKGIHIQGSKNILVNCLIEKGGSVSYTDELSENACITLTDNAMATFSGNTFKESSGFGLVVKDNAEFVEDKQTLTPAFSNNKFVSNSHGPMKVPISVFNELISPDFTQEEGGTTLDVYESVYSTNETNEPTLAYFGIPYRFTGTVTFNKNLTILPGTEIYFARVGGIIVNGSLHINGTSSKPVIMDAVTGTPGSWNGIYVKNSNVTITHTKILNAGYRALDELNEPAALTSESKLVLTDSEIRSTTGIGVNLRSSGYIEYSTDLSGNTFSDNTKSAIRLGFDDVHKAVEGNTIQTPSSSTAAIEIRKGRTDFLGTWKDLDTDVDYKIIDSVRIVATKQLTIEPGVNITFNKGTSLTILGSLNASGTGTSTISFTGTESTAGYWNGIYIATDNQVIMDYVIIQYGGGNPENSANVIIQPAAVNTSITNSTITESAGYGVLIKTGASDFGINNPDSNNSLAGNLGGFHNEN